MRLYEDIQSRTNQNNFPLYIFKSLPRTLFNLKNFKTVKMRLNGI